MPGLRNWSGTPDVSSLPYCDGLHQHCESCFMQLTSSCCLFKLEVNTNHTGAGDVLIQEDAAGIFLKGFCRPRETIVLLRKKPWICWGHFNTSSCMLAPLCRQLLFTLTITLPQCIYNNNQRLAAALSSEYCTEYCVYWTITFLCLGFNMFSVRGINVQIMKQI